MLKKLYFNLPIVLQNFVISIVGYNIKRERFDKIFYQLLKFYKSTNDKELIKLEEERLKYFIKNAQLSSFWKERFLNYNLNINSDSIFEEIKKLPILTKEEVKQNIDRIKIGKKLKKCHTSGTTGSGLVFYETKKAQSERWALWWRYRFWHGIDMETWYGWFGGMSIIPLTQIEPPYYRVNYPEKRIMFSAHHLNENTTNHYADVIVKRKLSWLHGYPSQLGHFASLCLDCNINFRFVSNITLGAENLLENQKDKIRRVFPNAKISEHYGLAESVTNISENIEGELKLDRFFSYTEFIPTGVKDKYWIVGTNLSNPSFPMIRYNTNDIATIINGKIISIDGRKEDYVVLPNGTKYGRLDHLFKGLINIKEAQIHQVSKDTVYFYIVKGKYFDSENEIEKLIYEIDLRFKNKMNYEIIFQKEIIKSNSGKLRFVISDLEN